MAIIIRPLQSLDEYHAVERLQAQVWGMTDRVEVVPAHLLLTMQMHGGVVLGAFDDAVETNAGLVGFVFGFAGLAEDGTVKHCSHMAAAAPEYRDHHIGYRLKLAQRERVLAQGLKLMVWTYDPLETRNGNLNLHKLGAVCHKYYRDLYGQLGEALNAGLPTDRLQVEWPIASAHVAAAVNGTRTRLLPSDLREQGVPVVCGPGSDPCLPPGLTPETPRFMLEVPANFQAIKASDFRLARAWREHTRSVFEGAFAAGFTAMDLLSERDRRYYLLEKGFDPSKP